MSHRLTPDLALSAGLPEDRFPETLEEANMVQEILAKELEKMSLDEHEKVLFDVHGIADVPDEDPKLVQSQLEQLEELLNSSQIPDNEAYQEVARLNPEYAAEYRRTFLRGEKYNVRLAAEKLAQHFHVKKQLFGDHHDNSSSSNSSSSSSILARDIRQSDLTEKAKKILESGFMQACNERDSTGRAVVFMTSQYYKDGISALDLGQSILYYGMKFLRDDETLRYGMVWVFYNLNNVPAEKEYMEYVYGVEKSLAGRISAMHYCYTHERLRPYVSGLQLFFAEQDRFRLRPFMGSLEEIQFQMQTYGIPTHLSPVEQQQQQHMGGGGGGGWSVDWLKETLQVQRLMEEKEELLMEQARASKVTTKGSSPVAEARSSTCIEPTSTSTVVGEEDEQAVKTIVIPRRFDVILGKSAQAREHTGNRRAIHLCHMNFETYEQAGKFKKTEVAERIVSIIRESGGRFVKWEEDRGGWVEELDELVARKKIGHFLRYMRSKTNKTTTGGDVVNSTGKDSSSSSKRVTTLSVSPEPETLPEDRGMSSNTPSSRRFKV